MEQETQNQKLGFFKKIWYSIDKIEKYGEMSAQGFPRAISYLFQIIIILALIVAGTTLYQTRNAINGVVILKDRVIIKQAGITGTLNYKYEDLVNQIGMSNFDKEQVIEFVTGTQMTSIYLGII